MNTFTKQELTKILEAINFINDGDPITCDVSMKIDKILGHNSFKELEKYTNLRKRLDRDEIY